MKKTNLILMATILLTSQFIFAQNDDCDDNEVVDEYNITTRQYKDLDVSISYGMGELTIGPSNDKDLIQGSITYDQHNTKPIVDMEKVSSSGVLTIKTEKEDGDKFCDHISRDFDKELEFYFPSQIKTDLFLEFGVGDADIDLTNISVTKLDINCGMSDVDIQINDRNDVTCKSVKIENGLGDLDIIGLGNLAAKNIDINIGLGSASIDLSGDKIYDTDVDVDVGLGSLDLVLPKNANVKVKVDASFLSSVDIYGLKKKKDKYWVSPNWDNSYPTINMNVNVGMGSVDVVVED